MAPTAHSQGSIHDIEKRLKDIVQNLYNLYAQAVNHQGQVTQEALKREMATLVQNLVKLSQEAPSVNVYIPPDLIQYVEGSRNPDVFTREFVETVQRLNQSLRGRTDAYRLLRDTLAKDIVSGIPELKDDVENVLATTGDRVPT
ncbi:mediator of RNA polymerase II transcription subunit 10 [Sporormia fimetaria CBS 119925]|uniref:Mediator of RNA polymerase II transcription subunit 10 n=1 Tax=Sporormia fimetaria CBS 119925 TaxID=1340428 RepID=A0A6A6V9V4_9PLEO|nr:mediator of RNA polymerase II transcription subunit 10 [Sporormia fimetaria CBS 119925]